MIKKYKKISIIYGSTGRTHAAHLHQKISTLADEMRYPLQSFIVMERILTTDILSDVTNLFRESEICVAILTADDCCIEDGRQYYRLRQNVVMELGMALFHLGRKHCILLSTFDPKDPAVQLPSDISGVEIHRFDDSNKEAVFDDVLQKILLLSNENEEISRYDQLLFRKEYLIDYETLFADQTPVMISPDKSFARCMLDLWLDECSQLPHYDERLLYFFERVGLMPIFGKNKAALDWYQQIQKHVCFYDRSDAAQCGDSRLLNELVRLAEAVIRYNVLKTDLDHPASLRDYLALFEEFDMLSLPDLSTLNPLIGIIYYDFFGLTAMRIFNANHEEKYIRHAIFCFETLIKDYVHRIDLVLNIWMGFLSYNLGRAYEHLYSLYPQQTNYLQDMDASTRKAIHIRRRWLSFPWFSDQIKYSLSYEYFVAKLEHIKMCRRHNLIPLDDIRIEFQQLVGELNAFCNREEKLEALNQLRTLLHSFGSEL